MNIASLKSVQGDFLFTYSRFKYLYFL